eukprot:314514-Rhodomonas_salina.1
MALPTSTPPSWYTETPGRSECINVSTRQRVGWHTHKTTVYTSETKTTKHLSSTKCTRRVGVLALIAQGRHTRDVVMLEPTGVVLAADIIPKRVWAHTGCQVSTRHREACA